jgi:hypothetical protein
MKYRPLVLVCLVALVLSLSPTSVTDAAAPAAPRPSVVFLSGQQALSGVAPDAPAGALQALRVGFTESKLFTVVCREWAADGDIASTQGSWYLGEQPSVAQVARSIPIVGHACAFTEDPSVENGVILALDIPVVILYAKVVVDGVVAVNGIAMTVSALAPVALAAGPAGVASAIQLLRTQVNGYLAVIQQDLATARREQARTAELQAYIKENHDWTVVLNEEWATSALPKVVRAALADTQVRQAAGRALESAGDAVGSAAGQGAAAVGESAASVGLAVGSGAQSALGVASNAAAKIGGLFLEGCNRLPAAWSLPCPAARP